MPLTIIKGPPNSGRTDELERRYLASISERPVLVVPGVDDIFGWERRLAGERGALVGGQIVHFKDLYTEILNLVPDPRPRRAAELQRLHLTRRAIELGHKDLKDRLDQQPGLVSAVLDLIDDFRAEMLDPDTAMERVRDQLLVHLIPYVRVFGHYIRLLEEAELTDSPEEARAAIAATPTVWRNRPVMFAGFDEMTGQQVEMVRRLAFDCEVEVMVAVSHEPENPAMKLTDELVARLENLGPPEQVESRTTKRPDDLPHASNLVRIQERFLRPGFDRSIDGTGDDSLTTLRSSGIRNEAEAIGAEIARLIADGGDPGDIAVGIEAPAQNGKLLRDTLERYRIPVSLEAETRVGQTVVGQSVRRLVAARRPGAQVSALIAYLRAPGSLDPELVDELELRWRINDPGSAAVAMEQLLRTGAKVPEWQELEAGKPAIEVIPVVARRVALAILAADLQGIPSAETRIEMRASEAIRRACGELDGISDPDEQAATISEALAAGLISVWGVPDQGTVRIASPYSLRAKRFKHLFLASQQEASIADTDRIGPFMSAGERERLQMSRRRDPEDQQRYLFYSCVTVPTERLYLSCRVSDETGAPEHPSPLVKAVEELYATGPDGQPTYRTGGRLGGAITFSPGQAPTEDELARSLRGEQEAIVKVPGIGEDLREEIHEAMAAAAEANVRTATLDDLTDEFVLARLAENDVYSATELEAYSRCEYGWLFEKQINPQTFGPEPDYFALGTLVHAVLESLYSTAEPTGTMPADGMVPDGWTDKLDDLIEEAAKARLGTDSVRHQTLRSQARRQVELYLQRQAAVSNPRLRPAIFELSFGRHDDQREAVEVGDWKLKGVIDRIDLSPEVDPKLPREAAIIDYKTGKVEAAYGQAQMERHGRFQVALYMYATDKLKAPNGSRMTPVAGFFSPVRLADGQSRGAFEKEAESDLTVEMLERNVAPSDGVEDIDAIIETGVRLASEAVDGISRGKLRHAKDECRSHFDSPIIRNAELDPEGER